MTLAQQPPPQPQAATPSLVVVVVVVVVVDVVGVAFFLSLAARREREKLFPFGLVRSRRPPTCGSAVGADYLRRAASRKPLPPTCTEFFFWL